MHERVERGGESECGGRGSGTLRLSDGETVLGGLWCVRRGRHSGGDPCEARDGLAHHWAETRGEDQGMHST
jgi:hypothetical protein